MQRRILIPLLAIAAVSMGAIRKPVEPSQHVSTDDKLVKAFKSKIYPLLIRDEGGCFDCHSTDSNSDLIFSGDPKEDLDMLIDGGYLSESGPDSLIGRLTSKNKKLRMPEGADRWKQEEIDRMANFLRLAKQHQKQNGAAVDERFPRALLQPYRGKKPTTIDNQFISYWQLKSKVAVIFEDDWVRGGQDRFAENVALFGGADFQTRFNETREPNAGFLAGLEMLAKDVAHNAYVKKRGPFAHLSLPTSSPLAAEKPTAEFRAAIGQIYEKLLFRSATEKEIGEAYQLLRNIYQSGELISRREHAMAFELSVIDPATGLKRKQLVQIPVNGDRLEVHQQVVDQSIRAAGKKQLILSSVIGPEVTLKPGLDGQRLVIHNQGTRQNVSFAGVEVLPVDSDPGTPRTISVSSPNLRIDGAWKIDHRNGKKSLEDQNNHKGQSTITVPLAVEKQGKYQLKLLWRANPGNADNILVELYAEGAGNQLASPMNGDVPELGEAHFYFDCGNDSAPFFQPGSTFQFAEQDYVEISNRGTRKRVTAGAVEFIENLNSRRRFLIDSRQAEGNQKWSEFNAGQFNAYNVKGTKLHDNNQKKGELSLRYRLSAPDPAASKVPAKRSPKKKQAAWSSDKFYAVRIYYPGKVNHESQVPVIVKAARSSPLIQLKHPLVAKSDTRVRLDASNSYTVQHSELKYTWRQVSGTPVEIRNPDRSQIEFVVPRPSIQQYAWSSLCAALMRHPDFLFTRPPSLFSTSSPSDRRRLQLVKIALDLVGRPPTSQEMQQLSAGAKLAELVDLYLASSEFRDYYFHRVRLMLESQGTDLEDEPARLWSFVAFQDRPFQEILTAEYTVDKNFQKKDRPAHHGKTGLLTTSGFIHGKPGLPHYNYAAQVSMLFLGYVYEVPDEIVDQREGVTALGTTDPNSVCYNCHKILTPLAFQRLNWTDDGKFRTKDENDKLIDASDRGSVKEYPFAGTGLEAFATQAVRKERFVRAMINSHVNFYFGRPLRHRYDERVFYKRLWDNVHQNHFRIRALIREIMASPEYLDGGARSAASG